MYDVLVENGILVIYCVKGVVKRILKVLGFMVEVLLGFLGKWEMMCVKKG